jgi:hypothetical protein
MASITIALEDLNEDFLKKIRHLFKNRSIRIILESDDALAIAQVEDTLTRRRREGATYVIPGATFDELVKKTESDANMDIVHALRQFKN